MRLLTKTNLYFLITLVPLLAITGIFLFRQLNREIDERSNRELAISEREWIGYLQTQAERGNAVSLTTPDFTIYPVDAPIDRQPVITDNYEINPRNGQRVLYRKLSQVVSIYGLPYQLTIKQSLEQRDVLIRKITNLMLFVFAGLFAATLIFNWAISRRLWQPFRASLKKIRGAELNKMQSVYFEETETKEFNELNTALNDMTSKINREYQIMKEFTENAAHEMQTPLAVVQSRLELLMQSASLSDEQAQSINEATESLGRLSKLNKGLLLIAKIENRQYESASALEFSDIINKYLQLFTDLIQDKDISVSIENKGPFLHNIHPFLADSLVSNLLGNAIKYNINGGKLEIKISGNGFSIANTGESPAIPAERLFTRFHSSRTGDESSNGLGLAIVKTIADQNGLAVTYSFLDGLHRFEVRQR